MFAQSATSHFEGENRQNAEDDVYSKYIAQLTSGSGAEGSSYAHSKYESNIDPELQADLAKYK